MLRKRKRCMKDHARFETRRKSLPMPDYVYSYFLADRPTDTCIDKSEKCPLLPTLRRLRRKTDHLRDDHPEHWPFLALLNPGRYIPLSYTGADILAKDARAIREQICSTPLEEMPCLSEDDDNTAVLRLRVENVMFGATWSGFLLFGDCIIEQRRRANMVSLPELFLCLAVRSQSCWYAAYFVQREVKQDAKRRRLSQFTSARRRRRSQRGANNPLVSGARKLCLKKPGLRLLRRHYLRLAVEASRLSDPGIAGRVWDAYAMLLRTGRTETRVGEAQKALESELAKKSDGARFGATVLFGTLSLYFIILQVWNLLLPNSMSWESPWFLLLTGPFVAIVVFSALSIPSRYWHHLR